MAAKDLGQADSEEVEDRWEIGRDDCDKGLPCPPFMGELCAVFGLLNRTENGVRKIILGQKVDVSG